MGDLTFTLREREVLRSLRMSGHAWHRPMDIGGRDGSHHHATLTALIRKGAVHRRARGSLSAMIRGVGAGPLGEKVRGGRGSYEYALTPLGRKHAPATWADVDGDAQ